MTKIGRVTASTKPRESKKQSIVDLTVSSPPVPTEVVLRDAIQLADTERLRLVLQKVCNNSEEATKLAKEFLLIPEEKVTYKTVERDNDSTAGTSEGSDDDSEEDNGEDEEKGRYNTGVRGGGSGGVSTTATPGLKRLRPRWMTCQNCAEEYDVEANDKRSCVWHPEMREPDYGSDIWADHDEDCHGRIADLEDEYPEGFRYQCCDKPGDSEGCLIGTHVEKDNPYKKPRYKV